MRTFFIALIALIVGAAIGYAYKQGEVNNLTEQVSALKTEVTDATEKATAAAAAQVGDLKTELESKSKLADAQQAKISELEAALKEAGSTTPSAQPTSPEPTASPDSPTTTPPQ